MRFYYILQYGWWLALAAINFLLCYTAACPAALPPQRLKTTTWYQSWAMCPAMTPHQQHMEVQCAIDNPCHAHFLKCTSYMWKSHVAIFGPHDIVATAISKRMKHISTKIRNASKRFFWLPTKMKNVKGDV